MLLSIFISFLLTRKFKGKVYILLMTAVLILISLFSIGVPSIWGTLEWHRLAVEYYGEETTIWQLNIPAIPLSFPFHASISEEYPILLIRPGYTPPPSYQIELCFLTSKIWANDYVNRFLTSEHIFLLLSSFLLVNLVGAILGYWISKTTFIDKLLKKGHNIPP